MPNYKIFGSRIRQQRVLTQFLSTDCYHSKTMGARDRVGEATNNHHEQRQQQHLDSGTPVPKATNAPVHPHHIELRPSNSLSALRPLKPKMSMTAPEREQPIRVDTGGHGGHITEAVPSKQGTRSKLWYRNIHGRKD